MESSHPPFLFDQPCLVAQFSLSAKQLEELHALLEFPADEIAALLAEQAAQEEKVLPRVMTFVVTPEQEETIARAVEMASDGTSGRDRKARGLANLAKHFLKETTREEIPREDA